MAGHEADTVCVENSGMRMYHLCLQRVSHDLVAAHSYVFAEPQNEIFLISHHWLRPSSSMNTQQPSLTKHRDVYAVKSIHVIHNCDCVYSVLRDGLHASHSSSLNIRFVQITDVFLQ